MTETSMKAEATKVEGDRIDADARAADQMLAKAISESVGPSSAPLAPPPPAAAMAAASVSS